MARKLSNLRATPYVPNGIKSPSGHSLNHHPDPG